MPQFFVFASGAGARIRALGFRPDRPARGRACGASRRLVPALSRGSCLSRTGGAA